MQVVICMACSYVFVEFINGKNEDQVSSIVIFASFCVHCIFSLRCILRLDLSSY